MFVREPKTLFAREMGGYTVISGRHPNLCRRPAGRRKTPGGDPRETYIHKIAELTVQGTDEGSRITSGHLCGCMLVASLGTTPDPISPVPVSTSA